MNDATRSSRRQLLRMGAAVSGALVARHESALAAENMPGQLGIRGIHGRLRRVQRVAGTVVRHARRLDLAGQLAGGLAGAHHPDHGELHMAAVAGHESYVLLTVEGAWLATKGYADDMHFPGMPALRGLMDEFLDNGGTIWACGACTKPRDITEDHLIAGASIIGAAKVVEEIAAGAQNVTFA